MFDKRFRLLCAIIDCDPEVNFGGDPVLQKHIIKLSQAHGTFQALLRFLFVREIEQTRNSFCLLIGVLSLTLSPQMNPVLYLEEPALQPLSLLVTSTLMRITISVG